MNPAEVLAAVILVACPLAAVVCLVAQNVNRNRSGRRRDG
jgi:hypothetical protein